MRTPFAALVLAAGRSRRLGRPKALARLDGEPLVARAARLAAAAGAETVVVVAAPAGLAALAAVDVVEAVLANHLEAGARERVLVRAGDPEGDALASARRGLAAIGAGRGVLLWPVDCPFADAAVVAALVAASRGAHEIVVPVAQGRRGHPVLFGAAVVPELLDPQLRGGARTVVAREPARVVEVAVADERVACDVDTPEDAARLGIEL